MGEWLRKLFAAIWAALTAPADPVNSGGDSSTPPIVPDNQQPPVDAGPAGPPWSESNPDPNDEDKGGYDHSSKWKPISETTGKLVVLTGCQYDFVSLTVGKRTVPSSGRGNGHRQHFRFPWSGARAGSAMDIFASAADGKRYMARVGNGAREQRLSWVVVK